MLRNLLKPDVRGGLDDFDGMDDRLDLGRYAPDETIHDGVAYSRANRHGRVNFLQPPLPTTTRMEEVAKAPGTRGGGQESTGGTDHGDATSTRRTIGRGSAGCKEMGYSPQGRKTTPATGPQDW
ncbi:hypothetical protein TKK_0002887 [Trichogramma kaykai]|uniref:Uncharacterized protein n=1 Tax=Trichogramma kaykai TaxID=54128 RepID=A0ABD2XQK9_9HYME